MKYIIVALSSVLLVACAPIDFPFEPRHKSSISKNNIVTPLEENINVTTLTQQLQAVYAQNQAQVLKVGHEIKITYPSDVLFGVGGDTLLENAAINLKPIFRVWKKYPQVILRVDAFTDTSGDAIKNIVHSESRAQNIAHYFVTMGIPADHITLKGYGGSYPIMSNDTAENRSANRRVVLTLRNIPFPAQGHDSV